MESKFTFDQLNKSDNILIWGAGYHTEEVLRFYKFFFESKNLFITDKNKAGNFIEEHKILNSKDIDYNNIDVAIIMSAIYHDEIECSLRNEYHYHGSVIGLYSFRRMLLGLSSHNECICHLEDFIYHMENGRKSYSYDYIFKEKFSKYKKIKLFAWWASSIGESIRFLLTFYDTSFKNKKEDEYYLLIPYIKGKDFANGRFIEIISRTIPVVTYDNCHFWKYLIEKYPERFDYESYNDYNGILVNVYDQFDERNPGGYFRDTKFPIISYTSDEIDTATHKLEQLGIPGDFVCIFARDNAYLKAQYGGSYYNDIRNMDIKSFEASEEYLYKNNIKTIRMGKTTDQPIDLPNCIDYAANYHSDFMDLYLLGHCKFYAGSLSGITAISQMQNVPTVLLGVVQLGIHNSLPYRSSDIYVPKKIYSHTENRMLTFTEMWDAEISARNLCERYYQDNDLEFIELTQEEIREAIIEMNEKIDGTYIEQEEEKQLLKKYHDLLDGWIKKNGYNYSYFIHINISGSFILKNSFLLEEHN